MMKSLFSILSFSSPLKSLIADSGLFKGAVKPRFGFFKGYYMMSYSQTLILPPIPKYALYMLAKQWLASAPVKCVENNEQRGIIKVKGSEAFWVEDVDYAFTYTLELSLHDSRFKYNLHDLHILVSGNAVPVGYFLHKCIKSHASNWQQKLTDVSNISQYEAVLAMACLNCADALSNNMIKNLVSGLTPAQSAVPGLTVAATPAPAINRNGMFLPALARLFSQSAPVATQQSGN